MLVPLIRLARPAAAAAAAGLLLTACGTAGSGASPSGSAAGGSAGASGSTAGGSAAAAGGAAATGSAAGSTGSGTGSATGSPVPAACRTGDLAFSWISGGGPAPGGGAGQRIAVVGLRNTGGHPCAMHGYPGVDLVNSGIQWPLTRQSAQVGTVTLAGGASARFTITYLAAAATDPGAFRVTTAVITPPNERSSFDLPWTWGAVQLQDGATHPGTYVGPVRG